MDVSFFIRFFFIFLFSILSVSVFSPSLYANEIQKPESVTIAYNIGNPPLKFKNNKGEADGILIDIWKLWSKKTGIKVKFKEAVFAETLDMLKRGEADIHAGLFYTKERDKFFDYSSKSIIDISYHIFHHNSISGIDDIDSLKGFKVGVPKGYTQTFMENKLPKDSLKVYENFPKLYNDVVAGNIKTFISPVMNFEYHLLSNNIENLWHYKPSLVVYKREYMAAVKAGNTELLKVLNAGLSNISKDEIIEIERKWLKSSVKKDGLKDTYIISCDSDYAPLTMLNEQGKPSGFYVGLWNLWAEKQNVKVKFLFNTWGESIRSVQEGLADFHSGLASDEEWHLLSKPFYELKANVYYQANGKEKGIEEFYDKTIGSIDSYYLEMLKKSHPKIKTHLLVNYSDMFSKLKSGVINGFMDDELAIKDLLLKQGKQGDYIAVSDYSYISKISSATTKGNDKLINFINSGLSKISSDEYLRLEKRWIGEGYFHSKIKDTLLKHISLTDEEKKWLKEHPVINVGADQNWPPFDYVDEDMTHKGIASDYIRLMEKTLGIKFVVRGDEWKKVLKSAKERELDMLACAGITKARKKFFNFSKPYVEIDTVIVTRKDDKRVKGIEDLFGLHVALPKDNFVHDQLKEAYPEIKYYFAKSNEEAIQAVALGKADAYVGNLAVADHFIQQQMLTNLEIVSKTPFKKTKLCLTVRNDWPELVTIFNKVLNKLPQDARNKILEKWLPPISYAEISKPEIGLNEEERTWLKEHPVIKIGVDPAYPPFEFIDSSGKYTGITADYIELISKRLGVEFKIVPDITWNQVLEGAKNRTLDLVPLATPNDERKQYMNFTQTYIYGPTVIFMQSDAERITGLKDLSDKTVAVPKGYSDIEVIKKEYPKVKLLEVDTPLALLRALSTGEIEAGAVNVAVGNYLIQKNNLTNLKVAAYANTSPGALAMGVRSDWPLLVSILDKAIASIDEHEHQIIRNTWVPLASELGPKQPKVNLTKKEKEWLKQHSKVRLGVGKEWAPIEYLNKEGQLSGLSGSIIEKIEKMLDIKFVINSKLNWKDTIKMAKAKKIDALSAIRKTDQRSEYLDFTKPYISLPNLIFTGADTSYIDSMDDLKGKKVCVTEGFAVEEIIKDNYPDIELVYADSVTDGLKKLSQGEADAFIDSAIVASHYITKLGYSQLKISGEFPHPYNLSFGVRDDWKIFTQILQKSIDAITKEEIQNLYKKNLSIRYEKHIDYTIIWQISVAALLLLGAFIYWNRRLSYEVNLRKKAEDEANLANKAKSMFLANMSHEIRTPMNAVMGMLYLLQRTELNDVQKNYVLKAHNAAASLLGIINDILDFSKIEANKLHIESVDFELEDVISNLSNIIGYKAEDKGIEFLINHDSNIPKLLVGDPLRLGQILINIANNAVKFTDKGEVILSLKLLKNDNENVTIQFCIKDSGIGMSKDEQTKLFHEFTQVDSSMTRKYGGTGLGLTISKKLVSMMNGKIWIESSELGKGSIFCFTVDLKISSHSIEEMTKNHVLPEKFNNMHVLIVDDNKSARDILSHMLKSFGFHVDSVSSGKNAISAIKQCDETDLYSLILMDWKMPDMNGIETSKLIRADKTIKQQPKIIMVTAYAKEDVMDEAEETGLNGFLIKPVSPSLLFNSIMHAFGRSIAKKIVINDELSLDPIIGADILIVEDNEMNQEFAVALLSNMGLEVSVAEDGLEALQMVQEKRYDAILMDIQMPKMDGIEATKHIRELAQKNNDDFYANVPIIAMTALAMAGDREKSITAGMNDHVTKPINPDILFRTLLKWVKPRKTPSVKKVQKYIAEDRLKEFAALKGLYIEEALKRLANDPKIYKKILLQFKDKYSGVVEEIQNIMEKEGIESAERKCHELKGVSGNIGAHELLSATTELDNMLKAGEKHLKKQFQKVSKELDIVIDSIVEFEKEQEQNTSQYNGEFDSKEALKLLKDMLENLDNDIGKVEDDMELLDTLIGSSKELETFNELSKKITSFDIDGAKTIIEQLIKKLEED